MIEEKAHLVVGLGNLALELELHALDKAREDGRQLDVRERLADAPVSTCAEGLVRGLGTLGDGCGETNDKEQSSQRQNTFVSKRK